jgi:type IV pilus assembly protein PilX
MNTTTLLHPRASKASQQGFSLVTSLVLMLSVLLIGLAVMGVNVSQERIIGNTRDRELALQAAEATLRDAELDVNNNITALSAFVSDCTGGLCIPPSAGPGASAAKAKPIHEQTWFSWSNAANVRTLGQYSGTPPFPGLSTQPVYVVERLGEVACDSCSKRAGTGANSPGFAYRTTVRSTGARAETEVVLQSVFQKPY